MKPQDILFFIAFIVFIVLRKPKPLVILGLICMIVSIPLFSSWVFFTAQRLVYYSVVFLTAASLILIYKRK